MFCGPHIIHIAREHTKCFYEELCFFLLLREGIWCIHERGVICSDIGLPQAIHLSVVCKLRLFCVWVKICGGLK